MTASDGPPWQQISAAVLRGEGLKPYPVTGFSALFDWSERTDTSSTHVMPYEGQFLIDVVEIEDNAVHQPSKPDDEIVCVLNGVLVLTTDGSEEEQTIRKGESVLIPAGWAGIYRVLSEDGLFRELCIIPADYFDPLRMRLPSGLAPRRIEQLSQAGSEILLDERYTIEIRHDDAEQHTAMECVSDEIIRVLAGTLTLEAGGEVASIGPGSFVVLPRGFQGKAATTKGYQALIARWGTDPA